MSVSPPGPALSTSPPSESSSGDFELGEDGAEEAGAELDAAVCLCTALGAATAGSAAVASVVPWDEQQALRQLQCAPNARASSPAPAAHSMSTGAVEGVEDHAAAARAADEACGDPVLTAAVRCAVVSHAAYRVPTGRDYWARVKAVQAGTRRACLATITQQYRLQASTRLAEAEDFLNRLWEATGYRLESVAHTLLDLGDADVDSGGGTRESSAVLSDAASVAASPWVPRKGPSKPRPEVPPGWLLCVEEDDPEQFVVAVAGTQNPDDVFRDCMFVPAPLRVSAEVDPPPEWEPFQVHSGFQDGAQRIWRQLRGLLAAAVDSAGGSIRVRFTGHSLGGATALLLAVFCEADLPGAVVNSVYTFGAPNVFNVAEWPQAVPFLRDAELHQYVHGADVVPRALGSTLIRKAAKVGIRIGLKALAAVNAQNADAIPLYRFVGRALHYLAPGGAVLESATDPKQQLHRLQLSVGGLRPQGLSDHRCANYVSALFRLLDQRASFAHGFRVEEPLPVAPEEPAVAKAIFCETDPSVPSQKFRQALDDIFDCMQDEGLSAGALAQIFKWTNKVFPEGLIRERVLKSGWLREVRLDRDGWHAFVENACCTDIHWVARLLDCFGWQHRGGAKLVKDGDWVPKSAADVPTPPPFFKTLRLLSEPAAGDPMLCAALIRASDELFDRYARPLPPDLFVPAGAGHEAAPASPEGEGSGLDLLASRVMRPEALELFAANVEIACGVPTPSPQRRAYLAREMIKSLQSHSGGAGLLDEWRCVTRQGLQQLLRTMTEQDEVRVWQILVNGAGYDGRLRREPASRRSSEASPRRESFAVWRVVDESAADGSGAPDKGYELWRAAGLDETLAAADERARAERARREAAIDAHLWEEIAALWQVRRPPPEDPPDDEQKEEEEEPCAEPSEPPPAEEAAPPAEEAAPPTEEVTPPPAELTPPPAELVAPPLGDPAAPPDGVAAGGEAEQTGDGGGGAGAAAEEAPPPSGAADASVAPPQPPDEEEARKRREAAAATARSALLQQGKAVGAWGVAARTASARAPPALAWAAPLPGLGPHRGPEGRKLWAWPHERERLRDHTEMLQRGWPLVSRSAEACHFALDCCIVGARGVGVTSVVRALEGGAPPGVPVRVRYAASDAPVPLLLRVGFVELRAADADPYLACGCSCGLFVFSDRASLRDATAAAARLGELPVRLLVYNAPPEELGEAPEDDPEDPEELRAAAEASGLSVATVCALTCQGICGLLDAIAARAWHSLLCWPPEAALLGDCVRIGPLSSCNPATVAQTQRLLFEEPPLMGQAA